MKQAEKGMTAEPNPETETEQTQTTTAENTRQTQ